MRPLERLILRWTTVLAFVAVAFALLLPITACACKIASPAVACLSNLKQQGLAHLMYVADHDERFARRDYWMDAIAPYVKNPALFHDHEVPKGAYGYAFNAALDRSKPPQEPDKVPLVYDSVNPIRNGSDPVTSLPPGGRHEKPGYRTNTIGYADGHAKYRRYDP